MKKHFALKPGSGDSVTVRATGSESNREFEEIVAPNQEFSIVQEKLPKAKKPLTDSAATVQLYKEFKEAVGREPSGPCREVALRQKKKKKNSAKKDFNRARNLRIMP